MSRICVICISLRPGGTERVVSRVSNHLAESHQVVLLLLARSDPFYELSPEINVVIPDFGNRSETGWRWYLKMLTYLWGTLSKQKPELVLCFGEAIAPIVVPIARLRKSAVLVFNRASPLSSLRGLRGILNPLTYPMAQKVVVQTDLAIKVLQRRYRFCDFQAFPNPIETPQSVVPIGHRSLRIINVGTLGGRKNQHALLRAFANLELTKKWFLDFVGDGPDREMLERLRDELGLGESVRFLGQRDDVVELLDDSAIFAFTSLTEGFPNALAEALAAGCACISYDCPTGPSELIEHGVNGYLVEINDELDYARLLQVLVDCAEVRERFSLNATLSMRRFESSVLLEQFDGMIDSAISGERVGRQK